MGIRRESRAGLGPDHACRRSLTDSPFAERGNRDGGPSVTRTYGLAARRSAPKTDEMVLRLLAFNAGLDLATRLNTYLRDPDEYRALTRYLLHQGGSIHYGADTITVTLDAPNQPRVARALRSLVNDLNANPAHLLSDPRPITYTVTAS